MSTVGKFFFWYGLQGALYSGFFKSIPKIMTGGKSKQIQKEAAETGRAGRLLWPKFSLIVLSFVITRVVKILNALRICHANYD